MKVNILGTSYEIQPARNKKIRMELAEAKALGVTDTEKKKIFYNEYHWDIPHVLRHEIIHAMLYESGLWAEADWATNEENVDWIAYQFPKLLEIFTKVGAI